MNIAPAAYSHPMRVRPSWRQFGIGVILGIIAWLLWFPEGGFVYLPLLLLFFSSGLIAHAPCIVDTGGHADVCAPGVVGPRAPRRRGAWLREFAVMVLAGVAAAFAAPYIQKFLNDRAPGLSLEILPLLLSVGWSIAVIRSVRQLSRHPMIPLDTAEIPS